MKVSVFEWLKITNPGEKGITMSEKISRSVMRRMVCAAAGTKISVLNNAKCRGRIGKSLAKRLEDATKNDELKITSEIQK